eukprot:EG_transcript_14727
MFPHAAVLLLGLFLLALLLFASQGRTLLSAPRAPAVPPLRVTHGSPTSLQSHFGTLPFAIFAIAMPSELPTLRHALRSWHSHRLLQMAQQRLFWLQGVNASVDAELRASGFETFGGSNVNIAMAVENLMEHATTELILILEKDWVLVESALEAFEQLQTGVQLLQSGKANVVRYRSHYQYGYPMWMFSIIGERNEQTFAKKYPQMMQYFCNCFHWYTMAEMQKKYPNIFSFCGANSTVICVDSSRCNWTNNPALFKAAFWRQHLSPIAHTCGPAQANRCFEDTLDTKPETWKAKHLTVAFTEGLFKHVDIQKYGNKSQTDHVYHGRRGDRKDAKPHRR